MAPEPILPDSPLSDPPASDAADSAPAAGRRAAPRLRLAIPATFVSIYGHHACILMDLSRTGARIALRKAVAAGQSGLIEIGPLEIFGTIVRAERAEEMAINAMVFDDPISREAVLAVRSFAETMAERERRDLRDQVRRWVAGEN